MSTVQRAKEKDEGKNQEKTVNVKFIIFLKYHFLIS
jgi:hypothetical protein